MDFKNRPKIKDLKKIYKYDGFFLTGDAILGNYVCMWEDKKSNKIVKSLRKRGYLCIYDKTDFGGSWRIVTK